MLVARLNVTSRNLVSIRLMSIVIVRPSCLKRAMLFFLILSNIGPLVLLIAASPSSLKNPSLSFPSNLDNLFRRERQTNLQVSAHIYINVCIYIYIYNIYIYIRYILYIYVDMYIIYIYIYI